MPQSLTGLRNCLLEGDKSQSVSICSGLLAEGVGRKEIVLESIEGAMEKLDEKCTAEHFNLLEIMLTGRAVMACMKVLFPPEKPPENYRATLVIGSLKGDVHDLGKNIFKALCVASGYEVIDCGKDCSLETFAQRAKETRADAVGVTGLISSVVPQVKELRTNMEKQGLPNLLILAGGAALRQLSADALNVDLVAQHAFEGLRFLNDHFPEELVNQPSETHAS